MSRNVNKKLADYFARRHDYFIFDDSSAIYGHYIQRGFNHFVLFLPSFSASQWENNMLISTIYNSNILAPIFLLLFYVAFLFLKEKG